MHGLAIVQPATSPEGNQRAQAALDEIQRQIGPQHTIAGAFDHLVL